MGSAHGCGNAIGKSCHTSYVHSICIGDVNSRTGAVIEIEVEEIRTYRAGNLLVTGSTQWPEESIRMS